MSIEGVVNDLFNFGLETHRKTPHNGKWHAAALVGKVIRFVFPD